MMFRVDLEGLASYRNRWEWVAEGIPSPCNTRVQGKVHRCNCNKPQSAQVFVWPARKSRRAIGANGGGAR